jgi:hypothetical protein
MIKFFAWLLIPMLPIIGLIGGIWLMPEAKPRWKTRFDHEVTSLGYAEQGRFFLVAESGNDIIKSLIAVNIETGKVEQRAKTPDDLEPDRKTQYRQVRLCDDSHLVFLIPDRYSIPDPRNGDDESLVVFDWLNQRIVQRYQASSSEHGALNRPILKGTTVVAHGGRGNTLNFVIWNVAGKDPVQVISCAPKYSSYEIGLSETGLLANVMIKEPDNNRLLLIDIKKQAIVQTIPGTFQEVHWAPDDRSFITIELDQKQTHLVGRKYILGEKGFAAEPQDTLPLDFNSDPPFLDRPFITFSHRTVDNAWRKKLATILGPRFQFLLDRVWPAGQIIQLHDKQDGRLLHRFVNTEPDSWIKWPFPNQSGTGLIFTDGKSVAYWDIYPMCRWYPAVGLVIGICFGSLYAWRLLRLRPNPKQTSLVIPEATP